MPLDSWYSDSDAWLLGKYCRHRSTETGTSVSRVQYPSALGQSFGANLVGTETGSVGLGFTTDNFTEEAFQEVITSVKAMVAEAGHFGVTVGIEAGLHHPLYTASLTRRLLDEIPSNNLQIILDCANLMSPTNYLHQEAIITEALKLLGDRIAGMA